MARPTITPCTPRSKWFKASSIVFMPPLIVNCDKESKRNKKREKEKKKIRETVKKKRREIGKKRKSKEGKKR